MLGQQRGPLNTRVLGHLLRRGVLQVGVGGTRQIGKGCILRLGSLIVYDALLFILLP